MVGQEELDNKSVNIRNRDDKDTKARGAIAPLEETVLKMVNLKRSRRLENSLV